MKAGERSPHERPGASATPWQTSTHRLERLELAQIVLLGTAALLVVAFTFFVARANLDAGERRDAGRAMQDNLVAVRDGLRVEYARFLERRARGTSGTTTGTKTAVVVAQGYIAGLPEESGTTAAERDAARATQRAFADLAAHLETIPGPEVPIGSPADLASLTRFETIGGRLGDSVQRWIDVNREESLALEDDISRRTTRLMIGLPVGVGFLGGIGLLLWVLLDRARRRVSNVMEQMAGDQAVLRRVATRVAQEADPLEVFTLIGGCRGGCAAFRRCGHHAIRRRSRRAGGPVAESRPASRAGGDVGRPRRQKRDSGGVSDGPAGNPAVFGGGRRPGRAPLITRNYSIGVAVPISVGDDLWGAVAAVSARNELPVDAEARLGQLADLASLALQNADARNRLMERAATDPLTGLANHRIFQEGLRQEAAEANMLGRNLALVLLDLDHFKEVNDAHGHQAGDAVLVEVGRRLASEARGGEVVARIGGGEFAWILPGADGLDGWQAAERARRAVAGAPFPGVGVVTTSAGVCDLREAEGSVSDLFRFADGALYWAKAQGRNATYRYTAEAVAELSDRERAERLARTQALTALQALARAADARDPSTHRHSERVARLATIIAGDAGWQTERIDALRQAGLMHDVGKLAIPDAILLKPGRLTPAENEVMKGHAPRGAEIVTGILTDEQVAWVRHHHERWDGAGYPDGVGGDQIPDGARILALADSWDVMTSVRSYSKALSTEEALAECRRHSGEQFDPSLVGLLEEVVRSGRLGDAGDPDPVGVMGP